MCKYSNKIMCFLLCLLILLTSGCKEKEVEATDTVETEVAKNIVTCDIEDTPNVYLGKIEEKEYYVSRNASDKNYAIRTFKCPLGNGLEGIRTYYSEEDQYPRVVNYETYKKTWDYYTLSWSDTSNEERADTGWEYTDENSNYILYVNIDDSYKFTSTNEPIINDYSRNDYMVNIYIQEEKEPSSDNYGDGFILVIPTDISADEGRFSLVNTISEQTWENLVEDARLNPDERRKEERK